MVQRNGSRDMECDCRLRMSVVVSAHHTQEVA